MVDQYLAENPLRIGDKGHENISQNTSIILDGILIDSPEAVIEHIERYKIPQLLKSIEQFNPVSCASQS